MTVLYGNSSVMIDEIGKAGVSLRFFGHWRSVILYSDEFFSLLGTYFENRPNAIVNKNKQRVELNAIVGTKGCIMAYFFGLSGPGKL